MHVHTFFTQIGPFFWPALGKETPGLPMQGAGQEQGAPAFRK